MRACEALGEVVKGTKDCALCSVMDRESRVCRISAWSRHMRARYRGKTNNGKVLPTDPFLNTVYSGIRNIGLRYSRIAYKVGMGTGDRTQSRSAWSLTP